GRVEIARRVRREPGHGFGELPPGLNWFGEPTPPNVFAGADGFGFGSGEQAARAATAARAPTTSSRRRRCEGRVMAAATIAHPGRVDLGGRWPRADRRLQCAEPSGPDRDVATSPAGNGTPRIQTAAPARFDPDTTVRFRRTAPSQGRDAGAARAASSAG